MRAGVAQSIVREQGAVRAVKVIEDRVTAYPPHAICRADIPIILSALPSEWTGGIRKVRLSSALGENPLIIAFLHPPDGSLLVKSRGIGKERVLCAVLTELAGHALGLDFARHRRLQHKDESRVRQLVTPLAEEILPLLSQKKVWLDK